MIKTNLGLYRKPLGFSFVSLELTGVKLDWQVEAPKVYREPSLLDECMEWLEDLLRANPEGMKPMEVEAEGNVEGYSRTWFTALERSCEGKSKTLSDTRPPTIAGNGLAREKTMLERT